MPKKLPFIKMQGIGNDYVYVNGFETEVADPEAVARFVSDRHFGIGSDGLVLILPSEKADLRMRMFNADGSEAEMCGNASRCVAKYAFDAGLCKKEELKLETGAGVRPIRLLFRDGEAVGAKVDMGKPMLAPSEIPAAMPGSGGKIVNEPMYAAGREWNITAVSMGNPHAVVFVDDVDALDLEKIGPEFENHPNFPKRVNTEFVQVISPARIRMRVWERGAGETLACGTGACAALAASVLNGKTDRKAIVELKGGELEIEWDKASNHVFMAGPAVTVFTGECLLPEAAGQT